MSNPATSPIDLVEITSAFSVSAQIFPRQFPAIKTMGFTRILNVRPDAEEDEEEQPPRWQLEQQALAHGLQFSHIPIESGAAFPEIAIRSTAHLLEKHQEKTLAFCLTGIRSLRLWALGNALAGLSTPQQIMDDAKRAGFDLSQFSQHLHRLAQQQEPFYVADDSANLI